jgi:nucleoside-diphosphate-sugar epimerase
VVIHLGARTDLEGSSVEDYSANTVGVRSLIYAIESAGELQRVVFGSSRLVCRIGYQPARDDDYCPTTAYGQSKAIGEQIVRNSREQIRAPWLIVRPTSIWGPWFDAPYRTFFLMIAQGRYVHPRGKAILKSFGYVGNTVFQLIRLLRAPSEKVTGRTLYLADYPPVDVLDFANSICAEMRATPVRTMPLSLLRVLAIAGDVLKHAGWRNPPLTSFRLGNLTTEMVHDLRNLEALAGPLPYSVSEGIRVTVNWMRSQGHIA